TQPGKASIQTPVTTSTGTATTTYVATGCSGTDNITATASVNGQTLQATGSLTVQPASLGSIQFVSATPTTIGLKGTGGAGQQETSTVVFKLLDSSGGPVSGQDVDFALSTSVGGIVISPTTATSDANGRVQTVVQSGTVATSVRVTATAVGTSPTISTQSDQLTVTTGIADEDSFSLSAETLNPEAFNYDGVTDKVTVYVADRFNNPVPDGTAVTFTTEGGSIGSQCTTVAGTCSVDWVSQNPRPSNGRATVLATAIGEESFVDVNGNGVFDDGDSFTDLPEAYRDDNEDGSRQSAEPFVDFNSNGNYDGADGLFNGLLCQHSTLCSSQTTLNVRQQLVIVMSGSDAVINAPASIDVSGGPAALVFTVADNRNQPMPAGTTVKVTTSNGKISSTSSFTVPNTNANGPLQYSVVFETDGTPSSGVITIDVITPKGVETYTTAGIQD
ncbi:MAG: hypothetical protein PVG21_00295, partial [Gammaproteobacteria bacterium]